MSSVYQTRPVIYLPISKLGQLSNLLHIEQLILKFDKFSIDLGAWCYLDRDRNSAKPNCGKKVNIATLDKRRQERLKSVVDSLFDEIGHLASSTQGGYLRFLMTHLFWCDENGHRNVLKNQTTTRDAYSVYCAALRDKSARGKINSKTASEYQTRLLFTYQALYNDSLFGDGIPLIKKKKTITSTTEAQDESDQAKVLAWCQTIFDDFSDFVLNDDEFPFQLSIPVHKDWHVKHLWVFPSNRMVMTPDTLAKRQSLSTSNWACNYITGKFNTPDSIKEFYKSTKYQSSMSGAKFAIRFANRKLIEANSDLRHHQRKRLAIMASLAFIQLLFAYSGKNSAPILAMHWPNEYEIDTERQGFRIIKNRGNKGEILFELENIFLPSFKKYLLLRNWLLNDEHDSDLLFFSFGVQGKDAPRQWACPTSAFKSKLKAFGIDLPTIGSRQLRANRNEYANDHTDLATAAKASDHTIAVHTESYMSGTQGKQAVELDAFFSSVINYVTENESADTEIGFGHCESPGNPEPLAIQTKIPPTCGQPEGCLFCNKFLVHADEQDIRKLASGRYVIQRTSHLSESPEHFDALFAPIFNQISGLLSKLAEQNVNLKNMVERVTQEVDEEEILTDFWASELRYLIDLELVHD